MLTWRGRCCLRVPSRKARREPARRTASRSSQRPITAFQNPRTVQGETDGEADEKNGLEQAPAAGCENGADPCEQADIGRQR